MSFRLVAVFLFLLLLPADAQVGIFSRGHGRGKIELNLGGPGGLSIYPFINYMKTCGNYNTGGGTYFAIPDFLNSDDYLTRSSPTGIRCTITTPSRDQYHGSWYLVWKGQFGTGSGSRGTAGVSIGTSIVGGLNSPTLHACSDGATDPFVKNQGNLLYFTGTDCWVEFSTPDNYSYGFSINFLDLKAPRSSTTI